MQIDKFKSVDKLVLVKVVDMAENLEKPDFRYEQESQVDRLARKSKEMPIFPLGKTYENISI